MNTRINIPILFSTFCCWWHFPFRTAKKKNKETGNNSTVSEIEPTEIIEPVVTVPPEITHEEIVNTIDESATNEINQINVGESGQSTIAETVPPQLLPSPPNTDESAVLENEIEIGPDQPPPEFNTIDSIDIATEMPPASISQRKNRRKGKKSHAHEDNTIDEEFASRLDISCTDAQVLGPHIENAHIANYIRYDLFV